MEELCFCLSRNGLLSLPALDQRPWNTSSCPLLLTVVKSVKRRLLGWSCSVCRAAEGPGGSAGRFCWGADGLGAVLGSRAVFQGMAQPRAGSGAASCSWCLPTGSHQLALSLRFSSEARRHGGDPGISVASPDGRHHGAEVDSQPADERLRGGSGLREEVTGSQCTLARGRGEVNVPGSGVRGHPWVFPLSGAERSPLSV